MEFWELLHPDEAPVAIDGGSGRQWCYRDLRDDVARAQIALPTLGRRALGLLVARNCYECLVVYLAALNAGHALILLDAALNRQLINNFVETYQPDWIFATEADAEFDDYQVSTSGLGKLVTLSEPQHLELHPHLALLLTTSGSTGSPKLVRLTLRNLAANAQSIVEYLGLTPQERPITSLPMSYSYGLSVVNSHLAVGASMVFTDDGVLQRRFWEAIDQFECTSIAGVPYVYQMLLQTGLLKAKGNSLRALTQAGGRLDEGDIQRMYELARARNWRFYVMYGQTEATARISYVPWERLGEKIGSVGVAIPGGALSVHEESGELEYCGPNVMMGYAECRADLAKGDELHGRLRTGDLARKDADGYCYITGRVKRFLKMFGRRFNLDDAEKLLARQFDATVACYGRDDLLMAAVENANADALQAVICETFDLPRPAVKVTVVAELPRTPNGKLDYKQLAAGTPVVEVGTAD